MSAMATIGHVDEALEYAAGMLSSETDWEANKPLKGCPRAHFNNDDAAALRVLCDEVHRLRAENDVLTKATAVMGRKLDETSERFASHKRTVRDAATELPKAANDLFALIQELRDDIRTLRDVATTQAALIKWHEEREKLFLEALQILNGYTTHKAVAQWEQENPRPPGLWK